MENTHEPHEAVSFDADVPGETLWGYFDATPNPMKVLDSEGRILRANSAFYDFLKRSDDDTIGITIFEFMHPEDAPGARDRFNSLTASTTPPAPAREEKSYYARHLITERRYLRSDGVVVWANLYLMVLWNPDGSLRHVLGEMVDVTERRKAEHATEDRSKELHTVLNTVSDAIITCDALGRIELINAAAEEIFELTQSEAVGRPIRRLMAASREEQERTLENVIVRLKNAHAKGRSSVRFETFAARRNGEEFPVGLGVAWTEVGGELKYTIIARDLTEHHHLQERVRRTERMEAFGQLAGGVAHDFNNVLTIVRSYAQLVKDQTPADDDRTELLDKIVAAADRGARLTQQLLVFSPDPGTKRSCINLNDVVAALDDLFQNVLEEDISLDVELAPDLLPINADLSQIEQIVLNLVINARDAMPDGGELTVRTKNMRCNAEDIIGPDRLHPGDYVKLEVEDTGTGMKQSLVDRIFEPFFTTKTSGTGLGLSTVYGIVRGHNGFVDVNSSPDRGTCFSIFLPAHCSDGERHVPPMLFADLPDAMTDEHTSTPLEGGTILVAEDEPEIRASLVRGLRDEGYKVLEADDGQAALELAHDYPGTIDLLLTDIVMPNLNGWELAAKLPEIYPNIRTIFVSGYAGDTLERKRLSRGEVRISKPYDLASLKDVVARMLSD